jgi:DNA-binding NarL/FixJ family response regulator
MPVNVLIVSDQQDFARLITHHMSTFWDGSEITVHKPAERGRFHDAFLAAGYDVVVLDEECEQGQGLDWLAQLKDRADFPPIVYFSSRSDPTHTESVIAQGAIACLARNRIDNRKFASAMREAQELSKSRDRQLLSRQ